MDLTASTASSISDIRDIPVDMIIGLNFSDTCFIKGKLTKSAEAILNAETPSSFRKSALSKSKGVEKVVIFFFWHNQIFFFVF